jgi:hypothetical protein
MSKKTKRLTFRRLDLETLEAAHERFRTLAAAQPKGEIQEALRLAALVTSTLLHAVTAASDLQVFLHDTVGGRHVKH